MVKSNAFNLIVTIVVLVVVGLSIYALVTFPRNTLTIPVSFTIGADVVTRTLEQPFLADRVQVQVVVESRASLWRAQILEQNQVLWEHSAGQGEQTSFKSEWIELPVGSYTFTFGAIGVGSLKAEVSVTSKGGFW
jgi:hypothetical protein